MKLLVLFIGFILITLVCGFTYFALTDVPVTPREVSKEIPHDQLPAQ